jgi:hypothetical protein
MYSFFMSLVEIFDCVDENLNVVPKIYGLSKFYDKQNSPEVHYYNYSICSGELPIKDLGLLFAPGYFEKDLNVGDFSVLDYSNKIDGQVFAKLNKDFGQNIGSYDELLEIKKLTNYSEPILFYEEILDRIQENFFEASIDVKYSCEARELIDGLKGQMVRDVDGLNGYLMDFYREL